MLNQSEFNKLFPGYEWIWYLLQSKPISDDDLVRNYLPCKLWRMNNLYWIIDKDGVLRKFKLNYAQWKVYSAKLIHNRLIILKSRQQGISTFWLLDFFDDALFIPNLAVGLMAQGEDEAKKLLERLKIAWEHFALKSFLRVNCVSDNRKEFGFDNNSSIFIRTSFRSATLHRLHVSEIAKIAIESPKKIKELFRGTLQSVKMTNRVVFESTAENDDYFESIWNKAWAKKDKTNLLPKEFYPIFLPMYEDPDCQVEGTGPVPHHPYFDKVTLTESQKRFWLMQYEELGEEIYKEYPNTPEEAFKVTNDGTYYKNTYVNFIVKKQRVVSGLYDKNLPVRVFYDLGIDDYTVALYTQFWDNQVRIVDEQAGDGESINYYFPSDKKAYIYLPHDARARNLVTGTNIYQEFIRAGFRVVVWPREDILDGIHSAREVLKNTWVDAKCNYFQSCMMKYKKHWNEAKQRWEPRPEHDKWSHGADAFRIAARYYYPLMFAKSSSMDEEEDVY